MSTISTSLTKADELAALETTSKYLLSNRAIPAIPLHKWIFNFTPTFKTLTVFREEEKLKYMIIDHGKLQTSVGSIDIRETTADRMLSELIKNQPKISDTNKLVVSPKLTEHYQWDLKDKTITLLNLEDNLIFQIFYKTLNVTIQTSTDLTGFDYLRLEKDTTTLTGDFYYRKDPVDHSITPVNLKEIPGSWRTSYEYIVTCDTYRSLEDRISVLKNHEIVEEKKQKKLLDGNYIELSSFSLHPKWARSLLAPTIIIDHKKWAVTIINTDDSWPGHAAIIIESIEDGMYVMYKAHIGGETKKAGLAAKVILQRKTLESDISKLYGNVGQTATFSQQSYLIKLMLKNIEWENKMSFGSSPQVFFSATGTSSCKRPFDSFKQWYNYIESNAQYIIAKGKLNYKKGVLIEERETPNCITWIKEKLEIAGIKLESKKFEFLETPRRYTNPESAGARHGVSTAIKYALHKSSC